MKISIIMPSYCRPELLSFGLLSLSKQIINYDYEIIVLNDGIEDKTEKVCNFFKNKLKIKYIFTGQRNINGLKWRCPGAGFNIGVKESKGDIIILSSPEIFHLNQNSINQLVEPIINNPKRLTIPEGKDDDQGIFLNYLKAFVGKNLNYSMYKNLTKSLNTKLNFCIGMTKANFNNIKGFDKDFFDGYCFDDNDFIDRLIEYGCYHYQTNAQIIHLYNNRINRVGLNNRNTKFQKNKELYLKRKEQRERKKIPIKNEIKFIPIELKKEWHLNKIPKIAHFYWGESYLPYLRYLSIYTFMHYNPDWKIKFYYPKMRSKNKSWTTHEHKFDFTGKDYYNKLRELPIEFVKFDFDEIGIDNNISEVYKSNFLTWHILSTEGGLFSDTDIIYFDSMNYLHNNKKNINIDTLICYLWHGHTMGFLLSSSNNEFFRYIFEQSKLKFDPNNYQSIGTVMLNKLFPNIESIKNKYSHLNIDTMDSNAVYSYNIKYITEIYEYNKLNRFNDNSIGLHWYAGHPLSMKAINEIHENNFRQNNILSEVIDIALKLKILDKLRKGVTKQDSVLDVGCGDKRLSHNLRHAKKVITLDSFETYNPDIIHNLNNLPMPIKNNEYDITLFIDVIEHLEKEKGVEVMKELKRITKKNIFLFTPQYWVDNKISVDRDNNKFNYHKSLWHPEDFKNWQKIGNIGNLKRWYFGMWTKMCKDLTIHCMVRNEPFLYYAIKSVYPYAKSILLYDTGSYDKYTIKDIETLLKEDVDRKIIFKKVFIETDETKWNIKNLKEFIKNNEGKFGKGKVRQMMIDDTNTKFFMVLDGDEVRYAQTMETLVNNAIPNCPDNIYLIRTPINWFYDLEYTFTGKYSYPFSGGIYRTDKVKMNNVSPNEHHIAKDTEEKLVTSKHSMCLIKNVIPYAHFETLLKPHRRKQYISKNDIHKFDGQLPKVMRDNPYYIERFLKEKHDKRS